MKSQLNTTSSFFIVKVSLLIYFLCFPIIVFSQGYGESTIYGSFELCSGSTSSFSTDFFPEGNYEIYWEVDGGQINGSRTSSTVSVNWSSLPGNGALYVYSQIIGTTTRFLEASQSITKLSGSGGHVGNVNVCQGQTTILSLSGQIGNVVR